MNVDTVVRAGLIFAGFFVIRGLAQYRVDKRKRQSYVESLIDPVKLEALFGPGPGDDANMMAELRDTFIHLNRQAYAEEFYGLDAQITALDAGLPETARQTMRRQMLRLLDSDDRWLQIVSAKVCASLQIKDALPRLHALIADEGDAPSRYVEELRRVAETLEGAASAPS